MRSDLLLAVVIVALTTNVAAAGSGPVGEYRMVRENDFSSLQLVADGTFVYKARGSSCWAWGEYSGRWYVESQVLKLVYEVTGPEIRTRVLEQDRRDDSERVSILVVDPDGRPLRGVEVHFNSTGPYRSTNRKGTAVFERRDLVAMLGEFDDPERPIEMVTLETPISSATLRIDNGGANSFKVIYDADPEQRMETRTDSYLIREDDLVFLLLDGTASSEVLRRSDAGQAP